MAKVYKGNITGNIVELSLQDEAGGGVGGSTSVIAPFAYARIDTTSNGSGTGISWSNWNAGNGTLDITFDTAQANTNYTIVTDGEVTDDGRLVSVQNKTISGFEISLYDGLGAVSTPSAANPFAIIVYGEDPTVDVQGGSGGTVQTPTTLQIRATDEGTTAGDVRGANSVDLQTSRTLATQVASAPHSIIVGGKNNTNSGDYLGSGFNTLVGGNSNAITNSTYGNFIGGGENNIINTQNYFFNTITGGRGNTISSYGHYSVIGGGRGNNTSEQYTTISGGRGNNATGQYSTISGGYDNTASGDYSAVLGGHNNTADGTNSVAVGQRADTGGYTGSFAFADSTTSGYDGATPNAADQFAIKAAGGLRLIDGNEAAGYVLTSDANGVGTWQAAAGGGGGGLFEDPPDAVGATERIGASTATALGTYATISGGHSNTASGFGATVSGGNSNTASSGYIFNLGGDVGCFVGGGYSNTASGGGSTVSGGYDNTASGVYTSTVSGGYSNIASNDYSTVSGGDGNAASGGGSTVSGGNSNTASGFASTVLGGSNNTAEGQYSVAAGRRAKTGANNGSFRFADSTNAEFTAGQGANTFGCRFSGGYNFYSDSGATVGVALAASGTAWGVLSDRNAKENFEPVNYSNILDKVDQLDITTWNLKAQDPNIRHMGPMAQDFHAAFGLAGDVDTRIETGDSDGVLYAAIKGLIQENKELRARIEALENHG